MENMPNYLDFLKEKGIPLSVINPGSDEVALTVEDAFKVLELIKDNKLIILGGDILSEENNKLAYAYQLWGQEYHVLNWSLTPKDFEEKNYHKSYDLAIESINQASKVAKKLHKVCYIVFSISE